MKGKIAVIRGCHWCPYRAFDNEITIIHKGNNIINNNNEIAYCGYHKIGYDGTQTRIENALSITTPQGDITCKNPIDMPNNCPLPEGDDKRN
jgi:hypothetical protein